MAGTGDGLLQPTKLIQTDDFLPAIAPPGYYSFQSAAIAANADQPLYRVPDGMTAEVVDFGVTVLQTALVETKGATCSDISLNATTKGVTVNVLATHSPPHPRLKAISTALARSSSSRLPMWLAPRELARLARP